MRETQKLFQQHRGFWFKNIWKKKSEYKYYPTKVAEKLARSGVKVVDAVDEFFPKPEKQVWIPPADPRFLFPPRDVDDRNWHESAALTCDNQLRLVEGLKQIQLLTNTVVDSGLPTDVRGRSELESFSHDHHLMQRIILQSHLWDTAREKLPEREKPDDISVWNYKAEVGIPESRIVDTMIRALSRKCIQIMALKSPAEVFDKRIIFDHYLNTVHNFNGQAIYITVNSNTLVASTKPLPRFADKAQVEATRNLSLPDIYPMSPTIDLIKSNVYVAGTSIGHSPSFKFNSPHTLFLAYSKHWSMDERHANALMMSYAHCIEQAKKRKDGDLLVNPVTLQTVHTDGEWFGYTCFQLNTLENSSQGSIKNNAWVESDRLFEKVIPRRAMLRNTQYKNYNPNVVRKITGLLST